MSACLWLPLPHLVSHKTERRALGGNAFFKAAVASHVLKATNNNVGQESEGIGEFF